MLKQLMPWAFCVLIAAGTGVSGETLSMLDWKDSSCVKAVQTEAAPGRAFRVAASGDVKTPSGAPALEIRIDGDTPGGTPRQLWVNHTLELKKGREITISFAVRSASPVSFGLSAYRAGGDWAGLGKNAFQAVKSGTEWSEVRYRCVSGLDGKLAMRIPSLSLNGLKAGDRLWIGPVTIGEVLPPEEQAARDAERARQVKIVAGDEWRPVDLSDLYIRRGTALDLSALADRAPCGTYGRVTVNAAGRTVFAKRPEKPVRFLGHSCGPSERTIPADKKKIEAFADALMAQGYNMIRFHGINGFLMSRGKWDGKLYDDPATIPFLPEHEDSFHYLLYCLKQRGIYVYLDLATFRSGWTTADIWGGGPKGFGVGLIAGNAAYRANYRAGVLRMLNAVNPYTGMRLADDPVIAVVLFYNEQNLRWSRSDYMGRMMQPKWIAFLKKKYGSIDAVRKAWKETPVPENADWESLPILNMPATQRATVFACDMAEFIVAAELELTRWYGEIIREAGYRGLTSQWDFIYRLSEIPPRAAVPTVSMHAYHAHPSDFISPNSVVPQSSVITSGCSMFRVMAPTRFIDRPFLVSEYGQVFWNRYRHEQGLAAAYAALQEWDLMMVHSTSVVESGSQLRPFGAGPDPVLRAADVVTAYAYLRGDVAAAVKTVVFPVDDGFIFRKNRPFSAFNGNLAFLFAVSRIGIRYAGDIRAKIHADLELAPLGGASFNDFGMYGTVTDSYAGNRDLRAALDRMRAEKLIGPENRTDPEKGVYQSDTGEIVMDIRNGGILDVVTPRFEGVTIKEDKPRKLAALTVDSASCPAAVTVIAKHADRTVATDDSLLLVINTDALNSGMTFSDASRRKLVAVGGSPVLVQSGKFRLRIRNAALRNPVAYALKLNGVRAGRIPVRWVDGELILEIDTAKLPESGPTPFFEIAAG